MKIETGRGTMPLAMLIGIWSVSALTSLPGLAVSPILGQMSTVFPRATELEIQMLSSLPSLLIIPCVLLSGRLAERRGFLRLLRAGLWLFALSGVLYLLSDRMWQLLAVSALLGIGSGIIIPLSTGLISRYFTGEERTRQFGYSSAITNVTLVVATALTGYLAEVDWHLPFVVYLLPMGSIVLTRFINDTDNVGTHHSVSYGRAKSEGGSKTQLRLLSPDKRDCPPPTNGGARRGCQEGVNQDASLQSLMLFYFLVTYIVLAVTFDLPFLMEAHGFSSGNAGVMISVFFLSMMAPGFCLNPILRLCGSRTRLYSLWLMAAGLWLVWMAAHEWLLGAGCILVGLGYGILQPLVYDRTTHAASPDKATFALACVMVMNYLAILLAPFITDFFRALFHTQSKEFPFIFNLCVTLVVIGWAWRTRTKEGD